jgi:cytochrome c oxidase cbb3-type subunit 2
MPAYPWLGKTMLDASDIEAKMRAMRALGVPYTDPEIAAAKGELEGKNERDALIAYLQVLGTALKNVN